VISFFFSVIFLKGFSVLDVGYKSAGFSKPIGHLLTIALKNFDSLLNGLFFYGFVLTLDEDIQHFFFHFLVLYLFFCRRQIPLFVKRTYMSQSFIGLRLSVLMYKTLFLRLLLFLIFNFDASELKILTFLDAFNFVFQLF